MNNDSGKLPDSGVATRVAVTPGAYITIWLASGPKGRDAEEKTAQNRNGQAQGAQGEKKASAAGSNLLSKSSTKVVPAAARTNPGFARRVESVGAIWRGRAYHVTLEAFLSSGG
jgi:hypothetical protein